MENTWDDENINADPSWAKDVAYDSLEKNIADKKESLTDAFRPLSQTPLTKDPKTKKKSDKSKDKKSVISVAAKKSRKKFVIFLISWLAVLSVSISGFLVYFYGFLKDYQKTYEESLPYHIMDDFLYYFESEDIDSLYSFITNKPETNKYETKDNVLGYMAYLLDGKSFGYSEAGESTDKNPVYYITADEYIVASVTLKQSDEKRAHNLPIYELDTFEFYTDPGFGICVEAPEYSQIYVNDIPVSPEAIFHITVPSDSDYFEYYATLPVLKAYKIDGFYEQPSIKVVNCFGEEITPEFNSTRGIYEVGYTAPENIQNEMTDFAKKAVDTYVQVICREVNDSALDDVFTEHNPIASSIKSNDSNFKWFPKHTTTGTDSIIKDFVPYSEEAFYCRIEHTQHMLKYGVTPLDYTTDARFFYIKENGEWKVCNILF